MHFLTDLKCLGTFVIAAYILAYHWSMEELRGCILKCKYKICGLGVMLNVKHLIFTAQGLTFVKQFCIQMLGNYLCNWYSISDVHDMYMARASIRRAMTHRQFKWLSFCSINSYAHINTSKAVNN